MSEQDMWDSPKTKKALTIVGGVVVVGAGVGAAYAIATGGAILALPSGAVLAVGSVAQVLARHLKP